MSLETRTTALAQAVGTALKTIKADIGNRMALTTTQKGSLVLAINELKALVDAGGGEGAGIDDSAGSGATDVTWSADKLVAEFQTVVDGVVDTIVNGAPDAYDTLLEISDYLSNNDTALANLLAAVNHKVDYSQSQTLTTGQKLQACENIGVGDPEVDLVAVFNTALTA
jgi:hypothetical protein